MLARHHLGQFAAVGRHAQPLAHRAQQVDAALLVADVARQHVGRRRALAEVVAPGRRSAPAAARRAAPPCRAPSSGARRCRPPGGSRRAAARPTGGRPRAAARASAPQSRSTSNMRDGRCFHQAARQLLPDALGHQRIDFAGVDHRAHQRQRSRARRVKSAKRAAKRATRRMRTGSSAKAGDTWRSTRVGAGRAGRRTGRSSAPSARLAPSR